VPATVGAGELVSAEDLRLWSLPGDGEH
jgi:hypothetical protein